MPALEEMHINREIAIRVCFGIVRQRHALRNRLRRTECIGQRGDDWGHDGDVVVAGVRHVFRVAAAGVVEGVVEARDGDGAGDDGVA